MNDISALCVGKVEEIQKLREANRQLRALVETLEKRLEAEEAKNSRTGWGGDPFL